MNDIENNIKFLTDELPDGVTLVAVSKFHPDSAIIEAYNAGQRIFAESRPQEFAGKYERLPKDIVWHFIGHLQRNKVRDVVGKASLIESVDSLRLLEAIDEQSGKIGTVSDILLEVFVADEESKQGFTPDELKDLFSSGELSRYRNIRISGLMAMASFTDDKMQIRREFSTVKSLYDEIKEKYMRDFRILSMGMSADYGIAVECGANIVRIGSKIFGPRLY